MPGVLLLGRVARPIRRVPKLGWFVADPLVARQIYNDSTHFSIVAEGAAGHWWAQVIGDWVEDLFEGPGHTELRTKVRDLFTLTHTDALVQRVIGPDLRDLSDRLARGETVDIAARAQILVGRSVSDLVGMRPEDIAAAIGGDPTDDTDALFLRLFHHVEELVNLGFGTMASTTLDPVAVARAKELATRLAVNVPGAYARADPDTTLGRCRELGLDVEHAAGLAILMAVAGTDTLASAMTRMVAIMHDTGQHRALLAAPERLPDAVRETLRVTSPAYLVGRSVTADVRVGGRELRAGEHVKILTWTINNAVGEFSVHRDYVPETRQLWFGGGRHLCLGAQLVHSELTALLTALTADGRPWEIVERRYRRKVFIPTYETLRIRLAR
ncbi:putative cytochrome P450 [Nocardia asteroides NBRC 15531]|uniref:Cytochrome P450 n=1 Tax=Nocardia asteroides NBRC 15531 TaxID=1110697 RepID=U5E9F9_NOCAS|nr:cytochrome P450 [Nocardia asteroides NBRC 15531]GAD86717.1 putative cytochrome P450 [Nocardia asteroides NBRC 15531]SFL99875.1 Cytochrome P450 [Nocardia asteroides]VEG37529.1 Cytochrome P450 105A3 [Nocardia asteroides]